MLPSPSASALTRSRSRRLRLAWLWGGFALASIAMAGAVYHLSRTVQRELSEQADRAANDQGVKAEQRIVTQAEAFRQTITAKLASFHSEGLSHSLREWDDREPAIIGTFLWEAENHFLPDSQFPATLGDREALEALWQEFRRWRADHADTTAGNLNRIGTFRTVMTRTLDNPTLAARDLGYQRENLDILTDAGEPIDPWAGWGARADAADLPWVFWYQAGPRSPVRGAFVDPGKLLAELRQGLADHQLARLTIELDHGNATTASGRTLLTNSFPGYALLFQPGDIFLEKQGSARLATTAAALLLGIFLVGAGILVLFMRQESRDAERKATFVTQVSHELRTPLTSIQMFADMLGAPSVTEEKRAKYAGTIGRESRRLSHLIERLLVFNTLEKGKRPLALEQVDAVEVVRETLDEMDGTLRQAGMRAESTLPPSPLAVTTDRSTLKQALVNLLDNAVKYAREGQVIQIALESAAGWVRLRVSDAGPGIAASLRERIFEPFVQGNDKLTDKSPGVGLGLSIARGLLRNVGGDLVLLPSARGALFEVRLPAIPA